VKKSGAYDHDCIRTSGYKKLKAFKFFKEGHIKEMDLCQVGGLTYVKSAIIASMKKKKYSAVVVFDHNGKVLKAACECVAG